jgi:hypothetical protein
VPGSMGARSTHKGSGGQWVHASVGPTECVGYTGPTGPMGPGAFLGRVCLMGRTCSSIFKGFPHTRATGGQRPRFWSLGHSGLAGFMDFAIPVVGTHDLSQNIIEQ